MRKRWMVPIALILFSGPVYGADPVQLTTLKDRVSYSIGLDIGNSFKKQEIDIDPDLLIMGLKDALSGEKVLLTDQEAREALIAFQEEMRSKQENRMEEIAEKNSKAGEAFLAENKKKEGVNTLPSGLQYRVLTAGTGKIPQATDTVSTHYRGTLIDGTEFDSSYKRGEPATFPVSGVIKGWTEALQLMKVGSKWQLFIPADLAYGPRGTGGTIGPNSTLIFEVELLSIQ